MSTIDFHDIEAPQPVFEDIAAQYREIENDLRDADSEDDALSCVNRWDQLVRELDTWASLTHLRFNQDTRNEEYKRARDFCDEITPKLTELSVGMKRSLLQSPFREALERHFGGHVFALWDADILTYDPIIETDMVAEAKLCAEYTELLASAQLEFDGKKHNFAALFKYQVDADRQTRHSADRVQWSWFEENRETLDRIFDSQVKLRTAMARKLGFKNYIELGYQQMKRVDYNVDDVRRFREAVRDQVVPLAQQLRERQAQRLGVEKIMHWDEGVHDPRGNPAPLGDHDWMLDRAEEMFDAMGGGLDEFFRLMRAANLMDLKNREGKAGGGFCTSFATYGLPYIFANFNGTKGDVEVFTHEIGHAFQGYMSRQQPLTDYLWPTYESCEIHSMGLEFLTWPQMDKFFGDDAQRFRDIHLTQALLFLPYGVAVDHFQHLVYAQSDASPAERHAMWKEMEATYLPWRDCGDLPHLPDGGQWQFQRHIYLSPFYYIDYTLAQTCALQFWIRSEQDFSAALSDYVALCRRGGEAPFRELARSAGLTSPFEDGCLSEVVNRAKQTLGI